MAVSWVTYAHLHVHSRYSLLEGTAGIQELARHAVSLGMEALAITDRDSLFGAIPFARAARENGLRPIAGLALSLAGGGQLTLLAQDQQGYHNLCRLSTLRQSRSTEPRPGLPLETLAQHSAGLIVLTGGRDGPLWPLAAQGRVDELHRSLEKLRQVAEPKGLYVEVQRLDRRDDPVLAALCEVARVFDLPLAATHQVCTLRPEEADVYRLLTALRRGRRMDDPLLSREAPAGLHLLSLEEMAARFRDLPAALSGTAEVASRCPDVFPRKGDFLVYPSEVPRVEKATALLRKRVEEAAAQHYGQPLPQTVVERLERELADVEERRASPLVLMLGDGVRAAYEEGLLPLLAGPATSSLLLYLLGAAPLDPLEHGLVWEFFLTPTADSFPEVRLWLDAEQQDLFVSLVRRRWGDERLIGAGGSELFTAREAWRAVAQAYELEQKRVEEVARRLPRGEGAGEARSWPIWDELLSEAQGQTEELALRGARVLVGWPHRPADQAKGWALLPVLPAGVIPTMGGPGPSLLAQYRLEDLCFLGAAGLWLEEEGALSSLVVAGQWAEPGWPRPPKMPQEDGLTAALLQRGRTLGCHHLERPEARRLLREVSPRSLPDLLAVLALHRPAVRRFGLLQTFLRRLRGEEEMPSLPPCLGRVVQETQGLLLYREQLWRLVHEELGWSLEESWAFLRSLVPAAPPQERGRWWAPFVRGVVQVCGLERREAEDLWEQVSTAAGWAVSRAHVAGEALLLWWIAYTKAHDAASFMTALLTVGGGSYARPTYLAEARRLGLEVRPPHVHYSARGFVLERRVGAPPRLWMGLQAVRGLSVVSIEAILYERSREPFSSVEDFVERVRPTPEEAERLARVGALDGLEADRSAVLREVRWRTRGPPAQLLLPFEFAEDKESVSLEEILDAEREILGGAVSVHPLDLVEERVQALPVVSSGELIGREGAMVTIAGVVTSLRSTGEGLKEEAGLLMLEDREGLVEVLVPGEVYERLQEQPAGVVVVRGRVRPDVASAGEALVLADEVELLRPAPFADGRGTDSM